MKLVDGSYQAVTKVKVLSPETDALGESTVCKNWKTELCLCEMASAALLPGVCGHGMIA